MRNTINIKSHEKLVNGRVALRHVAVKKHSRQRHQTVSSKSLLGEMRNIVTYGDPCLLCTHGPKIRTILESVIRNIS